MSDAIQVGWREFCALPFLNIPAIKAKIDTGARTSALHAASITPYRKDDKDYVQFVIHPIQNNTSVEVECHSEVLEQRWVRNSGGEQELRYVILTDAVLGGRSCAIELTLTNREDMKFRMLLGREALKQFNAAAHPSKSFCMQRYTKKQLLALYAQHI